MNDSTPKRVGVLGAGQLALMLAEAARELGLEVICAGQPGDCAGALAPLVTVDLADASDVSEFASKVDIVTIESENIDADVLANLNVYPNAQAIGIAQDRLLEKRFFAECGMQTAPFAAIDTLDDLERALQAIGLPAILKTRRMGYDGRGQSRLHQRSDASTAWAEVGQVPCILEGMVSFDAEVSLIGVRGGDGSVVFYPLIRNYHSAGILRTSVAPYTDTALQTTAEEQVALLLKQLDYIGVLAVEFFVVGGQLLANEMAPRVHNSGHWTVEGAATSQFANHLRAITGMPLASTTSRPTVMLNCIGSMPPPSETALYPRLTRHDYGKDPRPGRKVGHLTFPAGATAEIEEWQRRREDIE